DALDAGACWEVLRRVAASPSLKRAARLREFLEWVGTKSLKEGRTDLHEQEIGQAVFGRSEGYDTGQDNIVRVSASELRKRIDAYFAKDGKDEPLIFEIPRGSYTPQFRRRVMPPEPVAAPAAVAAETALPALPPPSRERILLIAAALIALLLAIACAALWRQNHALREQLRHVPQPALAPAP
ncbi:MAG: hypothetical protein ACLGP3_01930, partial [Acidobacteriota bacterium]